MLEELGEKLASVDPGGVALLGLPYDENSSAMKGPAEAPPLIRRSLFSEACNLWSESGLDLEEPGRLLDAGDLPSGPWREADTLISDAVAAVAERGLRPLLLGGDHAVTFPAVRGLRTHHEGLEILHVDAHPDLYDEFEGNRASHACPFARILESGLARRLVQIGIRAMNGHQREQADRFGVEVIEMKDWRDACRLAFEGPIYLSVDMDGLDPAHAPGVSHREPGGLTSRQVIDAIRRVEGKVVAADIVEFNPRRDPAGVTAPVCAKLVKEIAARLIADA